MDGTYIDFEKKINYWIIIDVGQILETDKRNMVVPELAARYDLKCVIGYRASYNTSNKKKISGINKNAISSLYLS